MDEHGPTDALAPVARPWLFQRGQTGNPGGRPKGIAALVRSQTMDGAELVAFMLAVMRGRKKIRGEAPSLALRMDAAAWLADRGFGKAVQQMELSGPEGAPIPLTLVDQVLADADA